jgi:hydroxymethylbilane synthase
MNLTIGSRGSKLALWQANWVRQQFESSGHQIEIRIIKTTGDKLEVSLTQSGTKGLFIKEIEEALLAREVDLAVHSLKDLPTDQPEGLCVAAVPAREDARDVFISNGGTALASLPSGARIGTSSLRRQTQLRPLRADLKPIPIRGNIDTRLKKLERGDCDALVLAAAGVRRLGFETRITRYFSVEEICPAVGQGALAIELRDDDVRSREVVSVLDHAPTHLEVRAERAALKALGGGCQLPIAAYASTADGCLKLIGVVANLEGTRILRASATGAPNRPEDLGGRLADDLLQQGARAILDAMEKS